MLAALRFVWRATRGSRLRPWRSPYLRWRFETYTGKRAELVTARDFLQLFSKEWRQLLHFLRWTSEMQSYTVPPQEEVGGISRRRFLHQAAWSGAAALALTGCAHPLAGAGGQAPGYDVLGPQSWKSAGATHGLLTGCAVAAPALQNDKRYADLVAGQSSILVAENAMKWQATHPARETYTFDQADSIVAFADAHHIKIRGHNLCWHRYMPQWLSTVAPADGKAILAEHIERVVSRYAGRMHSWDVVNEAIEVNDRRPDGLRASPWVTLAGTDYIELAFRTARAADPTALLCYNDYGLEGESEEATRKRSVTLLMLRRMKARRVPIDAVGIQAHLTAGTSFGAPAGFGAGLMRFLRDVREMDLQVFITELDVNDRNLPADERIRDAAVADTYARFLNLVLAESAVTALLTWGITDRYSWLNSEGARADHLPERALPFDVEYRPKAAFEAVRNAIQQRQPPPPPRR